ncbi:MAG: AbgT family transporter [Eubacteriales bacterium]|nr:AbgT family transporter [Eubacteriales bacterium]
MNKKKKAFQLPHVYIILMLVMFLVVVMSWLIPSGEFAKLEGGAEFDPSGFSFLEEKPVIGFMDFFNAIPSGIAESASVIVSVLMVTGALAIYESTGAIKAGVDKILEISKGRESLVVMILTLIFAILGTIGFGEGGLPFIPLAVTVVMALGYDRMAGMATAQLGFAVGFTSGIFNLFTTGISQSLAGLPMFSAWWYRTVIFVACYIVTIVYLLNYCKRIKEDPSRSFFREEYMKAVKEGEEEANKVEFTFRRKLTLAVLGFAFLFQAFGALKLGWSLIEIGGFYVIVAIVGVIINGIDMNQACVTFAMGSSKLLPACLTIGLARGVYVLMAQAKIVDTLVYYLSQLLEGKGTVAIIFLVYVSVICFNFFVVSGSGKAMILMPILSPLAKLTGISQQAMVIVYQLGDGFTNYIFPTSGGLVAGLAMCDVSWDKWFRFAWKIIGLLILMGFGFAALAQILGI